MKHNLISIICHDLGRTLGCYGHSDVRSLSIDAFSDSSIRFDNCFCTAPQCSPSRAALWTGRYPHSTGVIGLTHGGFGSDLNAGERHLAQILGDNGYVTYLEGLQHEARTPERCGFMHMGKTGNCGRVADSACDLIQSNSFSDRPFYLQIGFFEPHRPFPHEGVEIKNPACMNVPAYLPDIPQIREDLADMEASIAAVDIAIGRIMKSIRDAGLMNNSIIMFTADHGIAFPHAKMTLYDPGIEVPLIMHIPGITGGKTYPQMISNVDIVPTILDLLSIEISPAVQGASFKGLIFGEAYTHRTAVFSEKTYHTYYDPMRAIRTEQWKLIANFENAPYQETSPDYDNNAKSYVETSLAMKVPYKDQYHPPFELYDLQSDPLERQNLADSPGHLKIRDGLIRELRRWMMDTTDPLLEGAVASGAYKHRMEVFKEIDAKPDL
ncbi:MAG: sulfatase [Victivallales bacterium]